jgi:hypothetical protein
MTIDGLLISQYLTVDIQQFSNKLAEIYSNIAKPVLDVMWVDKLDKS